jgi:hypothetical protein
VREAFIRCRRAPRLALGLQLHSELGMWPAGGQPCRGGIEELGPSQLPTHGSR